MVFKGFGSQLKTIDDILSTHSDSLSPGEEAELAVIYVNDKAGNPYHIGFCQGNEFSDHQLEKDNHYYLAQSKLYECSIGPEIYIGKIPDEINGKVNINRNENLISRK